MTIALTIKEEILKEYDNGFTVLMLAKAYKISRNSIYRWLNKRKNKNIISPKKKVQVFHERHKLTFREKRQIVKLKKEKKKYREIISILGNKVNLGTIYYHLKKAKLTKKKVLEYPTLASFEEYQKHDNELILKEYKRFSKEYRKLNREYRKLNQNKSQNQKKTEENKEDNKKIKKECYHPKYFEILYAFFRIFRDKGFFAKSMEIGTKIFKRKIWLVENLKAKEPFIEGEFYYHFGDCLRFNYKIAESEQQYLKAFEKFEETSNYNEDSLEFVKGACRSLYFQGDHYQSTNRRLNQILKETANPQIKFHILGSLGNRSYSNKNYAQSIIRLAESLEYKQERDDEYGKGCLNIALCHERLKQYTKALEYLEKADKCTKENESQSAKINMVSGTIYIELKGEYKKSEKNLLFARTLYHKLADERNYLLSTCHLARLYYKYHKIKKLELVKDVIKSYLESEKHQKMAQKYLSLCEL